MLLLDAQRRDLETLRNQTRLRKLSPRRGADFSSNDYLGLAGSEDLRNLVIQALSRGVPVGSGGSRLLRGNHEEHEALETEAATFFGTEAALFFSSGFAANATLLSTVPQADDRIFADQLIHASCHEGMRLARASFELVPHNDPQAFADAIRRWRREGAIGRPWIVVESLYSMDGDTAALSEFYRVARWHDAMLVVDEAHSTGVFGREGRGLTAEVEDELDQLITIRTCGKALGCEGALVCGPTIIRDFLVNRGRGFIFSTAPSPLMAAAVRAALQLIRPEQRRDQLHDLIDYAQKCLVPLGAAATDTQIIPLILGDDHATMRAAETLQERGCDVRGIRPPTVPDGTSRLRISISLNLGRSDIDALVLALGSVLR